jgi:hypothetical protein
MDDVHGTCLQSCLPFKMCYSQCTAKQSVVLKRGASPTLANTVQWPQWPRVFSGTCAFKEPNMDPFKMSDPELFGNPSSLHADDSDEARSESYNVPLHQVASAEATTGASQEAPWHEDEPTSAERSTGVLPAAVIKEFCPGSISLPVSR